ncbi:hypothetical protein DMN91_010367 [Ooceraea biroi]|uniref:Odorant receptor n=1 Tax=Ooceraea biroi TaxID=2015173 RepID=A0A026VX77_OOCBI|nr:uncharacterized protein LOC105285773 isoform X1 [Ooceraea biroi]EZA48250.1 hypothetical protein X777_14150 [Ooceraea biroi]RLU18124.1 hypothetical protein DMN91_010367 [Ooceraea biroi]
MHEFNKRYFKLNRILLKMVGLWPYQQSYFIRIQKGVFTGIFLTFIIVQLLVFLTAIQPNLMFVLKILSFVFPTMFVTMKYCLFIIHADSMKRLLELIRSDWNFLKDKVEIDILEKYAWYARLLTIIAFAFSYCCLLCAGILQFLPVILDLILPLNESRPLHLIVFAEYFINQEEYLYAMLLHEIFAVHLAAIALCCTSTTIMSYILHGCALLKVASYRVENAIGEDILAIPSPKKEYLLYRRIVNAVIIHRRAIEFIDVFTSSFAVSYDILIIIGVSSLSINLFQFLQIITTKNTNEIFVVSGLIITHLSYMFGGNYAGQQITDHGTKLHQATYNAPWYVAPLHTQKLMLFIMQRANVDVTLTFGSIFVASLEGFCSLTSTAISYFTMLYSTR